MARIALGLEYDGTDFVGWQSQRTGRTVQALLSRAIARVADHDVVLSAAGRTDTGVHASGQVVHFDSPAVRTERQWLLGINANLPADVSVAWAKRVPLQFDARRSALARRYRYLLRLGEVRSALARRRMWTLHEPPDAALMTSAAARLLGEHDFSSFRAAGCQSVSPMRNLISVEVVRIDSVVAIDFTANAFLYHMVRNIVGLLVDIGQRRHAPQWASELLERRDRRLAPATAPPHGLTLVAVAYAPEYGLGPQGMAVDATR